MKLEAHELASSTWVKIREHLEERLDVLRKKNDGQLDLVETADVRGQIKMVKFLLALDQPGPTPVTEDD